jgi:hypothetical protein
MIYTCRCTDGPAEGKEFQDYGPSVAVEIPYKGQVLKYKLVSVLDRGCAYCFRGLSNNGELSSFFPFKKSTSCANAPAQRSTEKEWRGTDFNKR